MAPKKIDTTMFTCCDCGEALPITLLSRTTVEQTHTKTKRQALARTDQPLCKYCEGTLAEDDEQSLPFAAAGRTDRERFDFDGLRIDPARWQAHVLSY